MSKAKHWTSYDGESRLDMQPSTQFSQNLIVRRTKALQDFENVPGMVVFEISDVKQNQRLDLREALVNMVAMASASVSVSVIADPKSKAAHIGNECMTHLPVIYACC